MTAQNEQTGTVSYRTARRFRFGLQAKSALLLTTLVACLAIGGGYFYFNLVQHSLQASDRVNANRTAAALAMSTADDLARNDVSTIGRHARDAAHNDSVRGAAILDASGKIVAKAGLDSPIPEWGELLRQAVTLADTRQPRENLITVAKPILAPDTDSPKVIGAVRMLIDTSTTSSALAKVQQTLTVVAAVIIGGWLLVGNLLVWRVVIRPVRLLADAATRLGEGDFTVRTKWRGNDELTDLADAFDAMAGHLADSRQQLLGVNEQLESKVSQRTRDLQNTNNRLRQEMAEKEDFLRAVSHDLGAPLRNIAGMAMMAMMKYGAELPEEVRVRLQRIQANVEAENQLISELLELSRITTRPQKKQLVDMGLLMEELAGLLEFELRKGGIALIVARPMPTLFMEKTRVRQVFQNLIDNAIKYMDKPEGGRVEIGYELVDGMHRFSVIDNGPGVPADQRQQVFYVFRRATTAAAAKVPGRGVGLALVKAVAATYDGRTWVEDAPGGRGAAFCIEFSQSACSETRNTEAPHELETCDTAGG